MRTSDFDYDLPPELIAQSPVEPRDHSRILLLHRDSGSVEHRHFFELPHLLQTGDLVVVNDSRVIPARIYARKETGGTVELLLIKRLNDGWWQSLARPSRRLRPGGVLSTDGRDRTYQIQVGTRRDDGTLDVRLENESIISECGQVPLPPYIHELLSNNERYQTVYAREEGSAAAPTAGLHFTPDLIKRLGAASINFAYVTLHVGLDTFRPVEAEDPSQHRIHTELATLPTATAVAIRETRLRGGRIVAVGTTTVRVLESAAIGGGADITPYHGNTSLMILPGHEFKAVDALITNFHLPKSTLLMLVAAFAGKAHVDSAYKQAIHERYRFYSFGDAMLIT